MIIIKICLTVFVVLICSSIGNIKSKSFSNRYSELKKFKRSLGVFKSKLEFTYEPISEIFEEISKMIYDNLPNVFGDFVENGNWNLSVDKQNIFTTEDKEVIKGLGKMLGKLDKYGQLNEIALVNEFLDKQIENAFEVKEKNEKLYKVLGKCIGIAIAIILF